MERRIKNSLAFETPRKMVDELSVPKILLEHGFGTLGNIMSSNGHLLFIKALTPDCNKVYIQLDDNHYSVTGNDLQVEEVSVELVPEKMILSTMDCIRHEVCGAAFDCKDGICVVIQENDGFTSKKRNFRILGNMASENIVPCPIVKLSQIKHNPEKTLEYVLFGILKAGPFESRSFEF